jgi:hypothetical protein
MSTFKTTAEAMQAALDALKDGYEIRICSNTNPIPEDVEYYHSVHSFNGDLYFWHEPKFLLNAELLTMIQYIKDASELRAKDIRNPMQLAVYASQTRQFVDDTRQIFADLNAVIKEQNVSLLTEFKNTVSKIDDVELQKQFNNVFDKVHALIGGNDCNIVINAPSTRVLQ